MRADQETRKRSYSESLDSDAKSNRRMHTHSLKHVQELPHDTTATPQDPYFVDSQLIRSLCLALTTVGFDSVKPSALEMFRAEVEEYMLHFLAMVRTSMMAARRVEPVPTDFIYALAMHDISPSQLLPHLKHTIPPEVTLPNVEPPDPQEPLPVDVAPILGTDLAIRSKDSYIPEQMPPFPSKHTYIRTDQFVEREDDARKIRELATQEGIQAEQALRKLAAKEGGKGRSRMVARAKDEEEWEAAMKEVEGGKPALNSMDFGFDGAVDRSQEKREELSGGVVNWERILWRKGVQGIR